MVRHTLSLFTQLLVLAVLCSCLYECHAAVTTTEELCSNRTISTSPSKSRQKRIVYYSANRRLTFPPGTGLFLTPTFSIPFIRNMPTGYDTGMTISLPFKLDFDALGWGSEDNPYGLYPSFGLFKKKRSLNVNPFGTTEHMYSLLSDVLSNLGYPGQLCLQRAICEMREGPLTEHYGWMKNIVEWVLTPSLNSEGRTSNLGEYLEAEKLGRDMDCSRYYDCSLSIFATEREHKDRSTMRHRKLHESSKEDLANEIPDTKPEKRRKKLSKKEEYQLQRRKNITVESLAHETKMKKRLDKIQAIAMLQSFKKVIR